MASPRRERRGALLRGGGDPRRGAAWWRLGDGFVDNRLLEAADRKWLEHGGGSAIGRVLKVDALLERANPSAPLEERCAAMGVTPEMRDAAALGEEDYENLT